MKKKTVAPDSFHHMPAWILRVCSAIDLKCFGKPHLSGLYQRLWNPLNYALIGGVGVLINYGVWLLLLAVLAWLPWWLINALAIIIAWTWNWANSVGPLGWVWGFRKRA